jgi:LysR family transcriptional regulator for bpeEF and oprC
MNKFQAMEVFVKVVDAGSFVRTAEQMQLPKTTVTTLIQSLESSLDTRLLHRTTRQVSVTADGAIFYDRCMRILAEVKEAEESMSQQRHKPTGLLRVDAPAVLAGDVLIPMLPDFFARYPDIELELGSSQQPADLLDNNINCAIQGGTLADSDLIARRIGYLHMVLCAAPAYIENHGRPQHPDDLRRHHSVHYFAWKSDKMREWRFTRESERVHVNMPGRLAVNDANAGLEACLAGIGLIQLPRHAQERLTAQGRIERLLPDWQLEPVPLHVLYPQNRNLSAKVRVFVEWLADMAAAHRAIQRFATIP